MVMSAPSRPRNSNPRVSLRSPFPLERPLLASGLQSVTGNTNGAPCLTHTVVGTST